MWLNTKTGDFITPVWVTVGGDRLSAVLAGWMPPDRLKELLGRHRTYYAELEEPVKLGELRKISPEQAEKLPPSFKKVISGELWANFKALKRVLPEGTPLCLLEDAFALSHRFKDTVLLGSMHSAFLAETYGIWAKDAAILVADDNLGLALAFEARTYGASAAPSVKLRFAKEVCRRVGRVFASADGGWEEAAEAATRIRKEATTAVMKQLTAHMPEDEAATVLKSGAGQVLGDFLGTLLASEAELQRHMRSMSFLGRLVRALGRGMKRASAISGNDWNSPEEEEVRSALLEVLKVLFVGPFYYAGYLIGFFVGLPYGVGGILLFIIFSTLTGCVLAFSPVWLSWLCFLMALAVSLGLFAVKSVITTWEEWEKLSPPKSLEVVREVGRKLQRASG